MTEQRGQDHQVRIFRDGRLYKCWNAISASYNLQDEKSTKKVLGTNRKPKRQTIDGHTGTIVFEVEGPELANLEYDLILAKAESRDYRIDILETNYYPATGQTDAWVLPGAVFSMSREVGGQDELVKVTLTFESEVKRRVE